MPRPCPSNPAVLVIGLDGATFDVLVPLADRGVMPNLAHLMRRSAMSVLNSTCPTLTPVAWTSFLTGAGPETHGIFDFRYLDHNDGTLRLNHAGRVSCRTLLDEVSRAAGDVVSLNLPMTYPAGSHLRGMVVGGLDSPSRDAVLAPYPEFARRLEARGVDYDLRTIWRRKPADEAELKLGVRETCKAFQSRVAAAEIADEMHDWRLMIVQFQTLDSLQHRLWHLLDVPGSPEPAPQSSREVDRAMRALDDCIGQLLELALRRRAAVVVVSDHGFGPFREKIVLPELLRRRGLLVPAFWHTRLRYRAGRVALKLRKRRHRRRRPGSSTASLARPLDGRLPVDWRRSVAVAAHGDIAALVYLNTRERFGNGPVVTSGQYEQTAADAIAALAEATHPVTGERLFVDAYSTAARLGDDPIARHWPDVVGIPADGFHVRHRFNRQGRLIDADPSLTGTHRLQGVLMINAPGVILDAHNPAEIKDVAPSVLNLLGLGPGEAMTGRVLTEMIGGARDTMTIAPTSQRPEAAINVAIADQHDVERRLRELGYLD